MSVPGALKKVLFQHTKPIIAVFRVGYNNGRFNAMQSAAFQTKNEAACPEEIKCRFHFSMIFSLTR